EHVPFLHELPHLPKEERQQQGADMLAVHVGIGQDDDLAVADLADVLDVLDIDADGRDEGGDFLVLQEFFEAGLFDIKDFAAEREHGLEHAVATAFGAAAGGIALDEEEFALAAFAGGAIEELAGEAAAAEQLLAVDEGVASLLRRDPGFRRKEDLLANSRRFFRVLLQVGHQPFVDDAADDAVHLGVIELDLGLRFEERIGMADANDRGEPLAEIVAAELDGVLPVLEDAFLLSVSAEGPGNTGTEAGEMRAADRVEGAVGEAALDLLLPGRVLHGHFHDDLQAELGLVERVIDFLVQIDRWVFGRFPSVEPDDVLGNAAVELERFAPAVAFVGQGNGEPLVEIGDFTKAVDERFVRESDVAEHLGVGLE